MAEDDEIGIGMELDGLDSGEEVPQEPERGRPIGRGAGGRGGARPGRTGRPSKVKAGMRCCSWCNKVKAICDFELNQSRCTSPCRHAYENLRAAAVKQKHTEWFEEQMADDAKSKKLLHNYCQHRIQMKEKNPRTRSIF